MLHTVGQHEELVARGQYRLLREGQDTGKVEDWNLHRLPDGSHVLRADVDGRATTDAAAGTDSVLVHLLTDPDGKADRLHVRFDDWQRKAEAQLTFFPEYAIVSRYLDGRALPQTEFEMADDVLVLAPCQASHAAHAYDEQEGGQQTVKTLELNLAGPPAELLAPGLRHLALTLEGTEDVKLAGVGEFVARHIVEDASQHVRLDLHDVLLTRSAQANQGALNALLAHYTRYDDWPLGETP